jgi:hypothetical protein
MQFKVLKARGPTHVPPRGFILWRLSDDGPGASRTVTMGRHPKPFTQAVINLSQ